MRNFFENLNYKMQGWMQGRYGMDELSKKMMIFSLIFFLISAFTRLTIFHSLAIVLLIWSYFRCFSKNVYARNNELNSYMEMHRKFKNGLNIRKRMLKERKEYKYFKCKQCKNWCRVPKGKGKIEITCRVCKSKMRKKS